MQKAPTATKSRTTPHKKHPRKAKASLDLFGPVRYGGELTRSTTGALYVLVGSIPTGCNEKGEKHPNYTFAAGMREKSDFGADRAGLSVFGRIHASLEAQGVVINEIEVDGGGEFCGATARVMLEKKGVHITPRVREAHVNSVESEHRRIYESVRPTMIETGAPFCLWEECVMWAVAGKCIMVGPTGESAHSALFQRQPDLRGMMPFYCWMAIYNMDKKGRFESRAIAARYLGPDTPGGVGAVRARVANHTRRTRSSFEVL